MAAADGPWGVRGRYNGFASHYDSAGNREWVGVGFKTPCQKILIDWILTYAKEYIAHILLIGWTLSYTKDYIAHIPQVVLTGNIKTLTKMKWEPIFADERAGVRWDLGQGRSVIES